VKSDILLLDISNNDEYTWTNNFEPPPPPSSALPSISPTSPVSISSSTQANIGIIIGTLIGGVLLGVGGSFLYKWNKNKQKRKEATPTSGNEEGNRYNRENLVMPKTIYNHGQEKIPENEDKSNHEPTNNNVYNHGQETIPIANDGRSSIQNINDIFEKFNEAFQTQEILQNSGQQNIGHTIF
jgi:hypothetical protein